MRRAALLLLLAACATPRSEGRQSTPTSVQGPTVIVVVALPFGTAVLGTGIDQQGDVEGSTAQHADARADVHANASIPLTPFQR